MWDLNGIQLLEKSINAIASGPIRGTPMAGLFASKRMDVDNVITVDMGGTSLMFTGNQGAPV